MVRSTGHGMNRWSWRNVACAAALLAAMWTVAVVQRQVADAAAGCAPTCVILIQVDGLEPKDVTQETTPYLWQLAHPPQQLPGGTSALADRSGWIWQAPRSVVATGTAASTASLLTGSYPELSGVPSDDFWEPLSQDRQRLGAGGFGDRAQGEEALRSRDGARALESPSVTTVVDAVQAAGGNTAVYLGDRGLAETARASSADSFWFPPGNDARSASAPEQQYTGDPRLCPIPRYPNDTAPGPDGPDPSWCPADDGALLNKAAADLTSPATFTFVHLAELGMAKRLEGNPTVEPDSATPPPQPAEALSTTDAGIAAFVEQYARNAPDAWSDTVLMVVGSHGYQLTPVADRVPGNPNDPTDEIPDLSDYVAAFPNGELKLVPQGTMATIYYRPEVSPTLVSAAERASALEAIKANLEDTTANTINAACALRNPALGPCIKEVLYVDGDTPGTQDTVQAKHPTWRLDTRDPEKGNRTGAGGDLVVVLSRGWAAGRAAGLVETGAGTEAQPYSNPYTASSGGPEERAVAALVNGPRQANRPAAVRNLGDAVPYYPASRQSVDPSDPANPPPANDPACPNTATDPGGLACANRPGQVGDDAEATGHEAQPVIVDFAYTISALLQVPFDTYANQLQGRALQEAFVQRLATPCISDCEPEEAEPEPPPPPLPPPPPPEVVRGPEFDFYGLVRGLTARVVDARNRTYAQSRRGTLLSTVRIEGDFGKPESALTLTFYRRTARKRGSRRAGRSRVVPLKAIARFDPFVVRRGHVTIRLKIPPMFKPTHIGVSVRQIVRRTRTGQASRSALCTTLKTQKPVRFQCGGPTRSVITSIADASRLHKRKGGAAPRTRR